LAQFGLSDGLGEHSEVRTFFNFSAVPCWPLREVYIYPYDRSPGGWIAVPFPFKPGVT
jgi:hypothetical protein